MQRNWPLCHITHMGSSPAEEDATGFAQRKTAGRWFRLKQWVFQKNVFDNVIFQLGDLKVVYLPRWDTDWRSCRNSCARAVALSLDLGDGVPPRARLGDFATGWGGWRGTSGHYERVGGFAPPRGSPRKQHEDRSPVMDLLLLLILIYVSIRYVVFKVFRIPINQWSLATAALGGIVGIALLLLIMNYNHPFTNNARIYFAVTPVLPTVRGRVIEVPVKEDASLKEGMCCFASTQSPTNTSPSRRRPHSRRPSRTCGNSRPYSTRRPQP